MVLPFMEGEAEKERAMDELPQAAAGKTIMTTEPKFIPQQAAEIRLSDFKTEEEPLKLRVRLIDCVGFLADGAVGHMEGNGSRMVKTPWSDQEIPFAEAASIGTEKVIRDHATIGIVVTTDGTIGELARENYINAEERTVQELKNIGKPFVILLNSAKPYAQETIKLASEMEKKYQTTAVPVNCEQLRAEDIREILGQVLLEFPVTEIDFSIPKWLEILPNSHWLKSEVIQAVRGMMDRTVHMRDVALALPEETGEAIRRIRIVSMKMDDGSVQAVVELDDGHYYQILSEYVGMPIEGEYQLMQTLKRLASMQSEYEKASVALTQARKKGYGVVTPERGEIVLDEPQVVRHGNKYGVKMKAQAPSINLIKAQIETEIAPIVGNEQQAEDLIRYIRENAGKGEEGIWETNIFGKSIAQIVDDGIQAKISQLTEDCQVKLQDTLQKIINDSNGGMICIII